MSNKHVIKNTLISTWNFLYLLSQVICISLKAFSQGNIFATESLLKVMKNAFYLISKAPFILKIFKFLYWLFDHVAKWLDKKDKVNFKFCGVTAWLANSRNTQYILPNILRSKGYQTMKFGQLIECNTRIIFIENHTQNVVEKIVPELFLKNQN